MADIAVRCLAVRDGAHNTSSTQSQGQLEPQNLTWRHGVSQGCTTRDVPTGSW